MTRSTRNLLAVSIVTAILLVIHFANPTPGGIWLRTAHNSLHVPLFGIIAVCILLITPEHWDIGKKLAAVACSIIGLGILSEVAQIPTNRDASFSDLIANWSGAAGFLCIAGVYFRRVAISKVRALFFVFIGVVLISWPLLPLAKVTLAYVERARILPSLVRFDSYFSTVFFQPQCAELIRHHNQLSDAVSVELTLQDCAWPGIAFHDLWPNWEEYAALIIEIENPDTEDLNTIIRVNDRRHKLGAQNFSDRFNKNVKLAPGVHTIRIALADIEVAPETRNMDMAEIDSLIIFASRRETGRHFILHSIRLE